MPRPRSFDERKLLDSAEEQFWVHGYAQASIATISKNSGVGNGSIYAAYGDKLGLFRAVFARYCDRKVATVDAIVSRHTGDFESAVEHYLREIIVDCTSHADQRGCLMLNTLAELGSRDDDIAQIGKAANEAMARRIAQRVALAVRQGEIDLPENEIDRLGELVLLISQGLVGLSRSGTSTRRLHEIAATSSRMSALLRAA